MTSADMEKALITYRDFAKLAPKVNEHLARMRRLQSLVEVLIPEVTDVSG